MEKDQHKSRRNFIKQLSVVGVTASFSQWLHAMPSPIQNLNDIKQSHTILFQGDSITDGNRTRNNDWNHVMGHGYQFTVASKLWYELPNKGLHFFNRGVSGNTISDLAERWNDDALALKPDVLSILIGINDTERFFRGDQNFSVEQYEKKYDDLLQKTKDELPKVQLVLGEPFVLPVGFMLVGLGTSSNIPSVYSIASKNEKVPPGIALAMIASVGYLGFLLGPPLIGYISALSSLRYSYALIGCFGLLISYLVTRIKAVR